jgi:hypothetical protein
LEDLVENDSLNTCDCDLENFLFKHNIVKKQKCCGEMAILIEKQKNFAAGIVGNGMVFAWEAFLSHQEKA